MTFIQRLLSSGYSIVNFTVIASLLFRDLSVDYAAKSVEDVATYYLLTSDIPFPFFDIIFGTQVILACYLTGRIVQWRMILDVLTLVFYLVVMLLYIFLELPAIQLFAVHRKRSEANFIRRYHLVMFLLTLFCVTFQVLVHSSHRYSTLYARPNTDSPTSSHSDKSKQQLQLQQPTTKKQRSSEKLQEAAAKARNPSPTPTTASSSSATSPATSAASAPAATTSATHLAPMPLHARGASSPTLKRSFS